MDGSRQRIFDCTRETPKGEKTRPDRSPCEQLDTIWEYGYPLPTENHGGLAQLGERLHGMQEVIGSSPLSSIRVGPL